MSFPIAGAIGALGALGGMFGGGGPEIPPELQMAMRRLLKLAKQAGRDAQTVPGALPNEQAALASLYAGLNRQFAQGRDQLLAARGTEGAQGEAGTRDDFLTGLASQQQGSLMGAAAPLYQSFIANRQNLKYGVQGGLLQAAGGMAAQAGGLQMQAAGMDQGGLGGLAQLAQALGFQQARSRMQAPGPTDLRPISGLSYGAVGGGVGGAMGGLPTQAGYSGEYPGPRNPYV